MTGPLKTDWKSGDQMTPGAMNAMAAAINDGTVIVWEPYSDGPPALWRQKNTRNGQWVGPAVDLVEMTALQQKLAERLAEDVPPALQAAAPAVVDANLAARQFSWEDNENGEGYPAIGGVPIGPPRPAPATTVSAVAGWDAGVKKATGGIVPIEKFAPDTEGFDSALANAIADADATGGIVVLEAGKTYTATAGVAVTDKHVRINFNGAKVVRGSGMSNGPALQITCSTTNPAGGTTPEPVLGLTTATYDWGGSSDTTVATQIHLASTSGWAPGDWAVLVSEDAIPGGRDGACEGERFRIGAISGNNLIVPRLLRASFATTIRIARMTVKDVLLVDPWVEDASGSPTSRNTAGIRIVAAVKPRIIRPKMQNLLAEGIRVDGSVFGSIEFSDIYNLRTSSSDAAYGYGVRLNSCCDFAVSGLRGEYLRHLFTTGAFSGATNPAELWRYGSNIGHLVVNGCAGEVGHAAFDCHEDALGIVFESCYVGLSHREPLGSYSAFKIRGRNQIVKNCTSMGPTGVELSAEYDGGGNHKVINHTHTMPEGYTTSAFFINYSALTSRSKAEVSGKIFATNYSGNLVISRKAVLTIPTLTVTASTPQSPFRMFSVTDSEIIIDTLIVDVRGSSGELRIFYFLDSISSVRVNRLMVFTGGSTWRVADFNSLNSSVSIGRIECDTAPNSANAGAIAKGSSAIYSVGGLVLNQVPIQSAMESRSNANATLNAFSPGTQVLDVPLPGARTVTEPTAGMYAGQTIRYIRTANATGAFNWNIGGEALTAGMKLERTWTGTAWITTDKGTL